MTVTELKIIKTRHDHRWTDSELDRLIKMWLEGADLELIAQVFGVSHYAINKQVFRLRQNGIPLPRRNPGNRAGRYNNLWTQEEVEYIVRRRNEGATSEAIANELDRTYPAVNGLIARLRKEGVGVHLRGKGKHRLWSSDKLREAIAGRGLLVVEKEPRQ